MPNVFLRLLRAYKRHGYTVRTGLNPFYFAEADAPFARLFRASGEPLGVGAGLAPQELQFLELLLDATRPSTALVIGNAFGWSSIAVGLSAPGASVVAMEAGIEGDGTATGTELTHAIAAEEGLDVRVVTAFSPRDTAAVVQDALAGRPLDFVLIDGLHVNEQLQRDIEGVLPFASDRCVFFLHDVLSWHMLSAFEGAAFPDGYERRLLTRCPSGPGLAFPSTLAAEAREVVDAFCDDTVDVPAVLAELGATTDVPGPRLERRLARGWRYRRIGLAESYALEGKSSLEEEQLRQYVQEQPADAAAQYHLGVYLANRRQWTDADACLRAAVALDAEWPLAAQQLGRVLREQGQFDEAGQWLDRAAALAPRWAAPVFERGLLAEQQGAFADAFAYLSRAVTLEPDWALGHEACGRVAYQLGAAHADAGRWPEAEAALREALLRRPGWAAPLQQLGRVLRERGALAEARECLEQARALEPEWAPSYFELGEVALASGNHDEAYHWFDAALQLSPDWTLARLECGRTAFALENYPLAVTHLRPVLDDGVVSHGVAQLLALAIERSQGMPAAIPAFHLAAAVSPEVAEVQFDLGRALAASGDEELALRQFVRAGALRPEWEAPWVEAFAIACRLGSAPDADRAAAQLALLGIESVEQWLAVANMDADAGAGEAARQAALRALALHDSPMEPLKALGLRMIARGDLGAAERLYRDLTGRFPEWAGVVFQQAQVLERLGRLDEARAVYERAAALRPAWTDAQDALRRVRAITPARRAS
ncbi:MAG: tetratricopeptide repeat protein [Vicinamibacterales bacterium]